MANGYVEDGNGAYFYDFYFDKDGKLFKTIGIEGIMTETVEDLYILHAKYHEKITDEQYVPVGSILACTCGSILAKLSADEAAKIYVGNGAAVLTCADCEATKNIPTFGTCSSSVPTVEDKTPLRKKGYYGIADVSGGLYYPQGYKCIPLLAEGWKQPGNNTAMIWRASEGNYSCALKSNAILVCNYGGIIGVVEVRQDSSKNMEPIMFIKVTVWNFFRKYFNEIQVAGIMGNAMQESTWNPLRRGNNEYWGLFQINENESLQLQNAYRTAGLDMNLYGYNVSKYQDIGAEQNIPRADLEIILDVQLEYVYASIPSGVNWITPLKKAKSVEEAAEVFMVKFEDAKTKNKIESNKIRYYEPYIGDYYMEIDKRRDYAKQYLEEAKKYPDIL